MNPTFTMAPRGKGFRTEATLDTGLSEDDKQAALHLLAGLKVGLDSQLATIGRTKPHVESKDYKWLREFSGMETQSPLKQLTEAIKAVIETTNKVFGYSGSPQFRFDGIQKTGGNFTEKVAIALMFPDARGRRPGIGLVLDGKVRELLLDGNSKTKTDVDNLRDKWKTANLFKVTDNSNWTSRWISSEFTSDRMNNLFNDANNIDTQALAISKYEELIPIAENTIQTLLAAIQEIEERLKADEQSQGTDSSTSLDGSGSSPNSPGSPVSPKSSTTTPEPAVKESEYN
jgi:hypothetical protein